MEPQDKAKLIQIAKKKLKDNKKIKANSDTEIVNHFIISEQIKAHDSCFVPAVLIYDKYESWAKTNGVKILKYKYFFSILIRFFQRKLRNQLTYYFISSEGFNLNPTYVESIRQKWISLNEKNKEKKKQKDPRV
jgi:hypothetical protein